MQDLKAFRREWSTDQKELRMLFKSGTDLIKPGIYPRSTCGIAQ